jgi:hypothetical protein
MFTPERIDSLEENEIFVFGSNCSGRHGAGAAYLAWNKFGAEMGVGEGLTGQCYALPTMDEFFRTLSLNEIREKIERFIRICKEHTEKKFLLTKIGCGIAGYSPSEIAPLFKDFLPFPSNLVLPREFHEILYK